MPSLARFAWLPLLFSCASPLIAADAPPAPPAAESASVPAAADTDVASLKQQLADAQDQLAISLRSYSLLEDEIRQLKADAEKNAAQLADNAQTIATLEAQAPLAAQAEKLRTQVRQLQDESAALAQEVFRLKTLLALAGPTRPQGSAPVRPAN
jgi:septal ring factor EnvC (AmiA/AmiB activator)